MGGRTRLLVCLLLGALALLSAGPALAQGGGTTTSAGDQQYIDPLATTTATTPAPSTPAPSTTETNPAASSSSAPTTPATTTSQAPTTTSTPGAGGKTLPYTGLNLGLVIAVGLGLIGGGLLLLRLARQQH